jgi:pimeloyl-ACP methyl ester carboxylesterase
MNRIYKSPEGERLVRGRYLAFLKHWPVAHQQIRIPTSQGETFIIASGADDAPPLLLLHGGAGNTVTWMPDVRAFRQPVPRLCRRHDRRSWSERAFPAPTFV